MVLGCISLSSLKFFASGAALGVAMESEIFLSDANMNVPVNIIGGIFSSFKFFTNFRVKIGVR